MAGCRCSGGLWGRFFGQEKGDLLDILGGGCQEALTGDVEQVSELGIAMAEELLGIGEGALDGLLAALIDGLAPRGQAVSIAGFAGLLPDMAGDSALGFGVRASTVR